jgi:uncharacterized membrane protein
LIGEKFGSVAIVATPIVVGIGAGLIGYYLYPYVTKITAAIGDIDDVSGTSTDISSCVRIEFHNTGANESCTGNY